VTTFLGSYEYQLDEKGRVSLPSAFRRGMEDPRFVLLQWKAPALTLFPLAVWAQAQERLIQFRRSRPDSWGEVLSITSSAVEVSPDKQGRILIPQRLVSAGGLEGSVLLVGNIDRVEIWNPDAFQDAVAERSGDFDQFATQIFG
jgi:transcriptional regulator MraZ